MIAAVFSKGRLFSVSVPGLSGIVFFVTLSASEGSSGTGKVRFATGGVGQGVREGGEHQAVSWEAGGFYENEDFLLIAILSVSLTNMFGEATYRTVLSEW